MYGFLVEIVGGLSPCKLRSGAFVGIGVTGKGSGCRFKTLLMITVSGLYYIVYVVEVDFEVISTVCLPVFPLRITYSSSCLPA